MSEGNAVGKLEGYSLGVSLVKYGGSQIGSYNDNYVDMDMARFMTQH